MQLKNNFVLIKPDLNYDKLKLGDTGIELQLPVGKRDATEYHREVVLFDTEKHACTSGIVVGVPEEIIYDTHYTNQEQFPYRTTMELRIGDRVIFDYKAELYSVAEGRQMEDGNVVMRYDNIILAIRRVGMVAPHFSPVIALQTAIDNQYDKVVCVNGYVIVEASPEDEIKTTLIIPDHLKKIKALTKGVIRYIGTPLGGYRSFDAYGADEDELQVGDEIIFHKVNSIPLQVSEHQIIDKGTMLYQMQRVDVDLLKRGEHYIALSDRVLVKRDKPITERSGILLLNVKPQNKGTVVAVGFKLQAELKRGDDILFRQSTGTNIDEDTVVLREYEIQAISGEGRGRFPGLVKKDKRLEGVGC